MVHKTPESVFDAALARMCEEAEASRRIRYASLSVACGSPIEQMLLAALLFHDFSGVTANYPGRVDAKVIDARGIHSISPPDFFYPPPEVVVLLQAPIEKYRADFLFLIQFDGQSSMENGGLCRLVVECDGHDFHERTKEQAERDKSRDRDMTLSGASIMRFTGREIYRDPFSCVDAVDEWIGTRCEAYYEVPPEHRSPRRHR